LQKFREEILKNEGLTEKGVAENPIFREENAVFLAAKPVSREDHRKFRAENSVSFADHEKFRAENAALLAENADVRAGNTEVREGNAPSSAGIRVPPARAQTDEPWLAGVFLGGNAHGVSSISSG
jgi:hypothetical protein